MLASSNADATWSILLVDARTGEIAVASATCLTNFDLRANTPVLIPGVGGATAQSFVDTTGQNRTLIRDLLATGSQTGEILTQLASFDAGHQTRQYGMIRAEGNPLTFSGTGAGAWAGGITGVISGAGIGGGDLYYAIQGNVLSGPSVVSATLAAVEATEGDLAEKLMAGMEAARAQGGDGRCSCSNGNPTGCGDPPPSFNKSSHIAYMLVAREGDQEGCAPTYRLQSRNTAVLTAPNPVGGTLAAFLPETSPIVELRLILGDVAPGRLEARSTIELPGAARRGVFADLTGDGLPDLALLSTSGESLWLVAATDSELGFGTPTQLAQGTDFRDIASGDVDGDGLFDLIVSDAAIGRVIVLWGDAVSPFAEATEILSTLAPTGVCVAQLDDSILPEILAASSATSEVHAYTQTGNRQFSLIESMPAGVSTPTRLGVIDPAKDSRPDVLVTGTTNSVSHIVRKPGVLPGVTLYPVPTTPTSLDVGDVTGDGLDDAVLMTGVNSTVLSGFVFLPDLLLPVSFPAPGQARDAELADLDSDGDLDLMYAAFSWQSVRLVANTGLGFAPATGCGSGDYFLNLNVPFAQAADPDPVFTLRDDFETWRALRIGVTDAVRSTAELKKDLLSPNPACSVELTLTLRDWSGGPVLGVAAEDVSVLHAPGSASASEIGTLEPLGKGRFRVMLNGNGVSGTDLLRVTIDDPARPRPIVLMPEIELLVADLADLDGDGDRDAADLNIWISLYQTGDPRADQNRDGSVTPADFSAWISNANRPC